MRGAAGGSLADVVKLNAFLTDLGYFAKFNEVMAQLLCRGPIRRVRRWGSPVYRVLDWSRLMRSWCWADFP